MITERGTTDASRSLGGKGQMHWTYFTSFAKYQSVGLLVSLTKVATKQPGSPSSYFARTSTLLRSSVNMLTKWAKFSTAPGPLNLSLKEKRSQFKCCVFCTESPPLYIMSEFNSRESKYLACSLDPDVRAGV